MTHTEITYNDKRISLQTFGGTQMVNATEIGKIFGKRFQTWMLNPSSKNIAKNTEKETNIPLDKLIIASRGYPYPSLPDFAKGTWIHYKIALHFAKWLSESFYQHFKRELLKLSIG